MGQHLLQANFTRGEVTPLVAARQDIAAFKAGAASVLNFTVLPYGGVTRRSGSRYAGPIKVEAAIGRIVTYTYSATQAYTLEFGNLFVRIWANGGNVLNAGTPVEVVTPYTTADLDALQFSWSNDVVFIAHPSYFPRRLNRFSHISWTMTIAAFADGPYDTINPSTTTLTPGAALTTGVNNTITASASTFVASDVGRLMRILNGGKWSWGQIVTFTSDTIVIISVSDGQGGMAATATWQLGAFSATSGYPARVCFADGRLLWGNTASRPRGIFASQSGLPLGYSPSQPDGTVLDSSGFSLDIVSGRADQILWLKEAARVQVGTTGAIRTLGASDSSGVMTARNVSQRLEVPTGTDDAIPVDVGPSTVFVERFGRGLHDLFYDYSVNSLVDPSLSNFAEHLFDSGVKTTAFAQIRDRILWVLDKSGNLFGVTLDRYEKIVGFHRADVSGYVESMCVTPGVDRDEVWLIVRRTINTVTRRYVEVLEKSFRRNNKNDAFFVDCGATYSGAPTNVISGLTWLPNTVVDILADGSAVGTATVDGSGNVTLPNGFMTSVAQIGLPITAKVTTLPPPVATPDGSGLSRRLRIVYADVQFYESLGVLFGTVGQPDERMRLRLPSDPIGQSPALFTGSERLTVQASWTGSGQLEVSCDQPLPATILAINSYVDNED